MWDAYVGFGNRDRSALSVDRRRIFAILDLEHLAHIGPELLAVVVATAATVEGWTLGDPTAKVREQLAESEVRLLPTFLSLTTPS